MAFDTKYRPKTLDKIIGHEDAVQQLRGFVKTKAPSLLLITGKTSVGKTTMGRAFAADLNGFDSAGNINDFQEVDGGQYRTKDELTALVRSSRFMPQKGKYKIILLDEAQYVLSNPQGMPVLMKEVEEPSKRTIWIFCSMDPAKFQSDKNGRAILNRAVQLPLKEHTNEELYKQGVRILKGEKMVNFVSPDLLKAVVADSNREMRTLAHRLEALAAFHAGMDKPRTLKESDLPKALKMATGQTDNTVLQYLLGLYGGSFSECQRAILDIEDEFQFVNQCLWAAKFLLNLTVLRGAKHKKVWWTPLHRELNAQVNKLKKKPTLGDMAEAVTMLVGVRSKVSLGNMDDTLTAATYMYLKGGKDGEE